jgi:hypothetical protein
MTIMGLQPCQLPWHRVIEIRCSLVKAVLALITIIALAINLVGLVRNYRRPNVGD